MSHSVLLLLRVVHVVGAAWWLGSLVFTAVLLLPTLRALGPSAGAVMQHMAEVRKLPLYMAIVPMLTVLAGISLLWYDSAGFNAEWMKSGPGHTYSLGGAIGIIVAIIGMSVNAPSGKRLSRIGAAVRARGGPPSAEEQAEISRLQDRLYKAVVVSAILLLIAGTAMAVARYM